MKHLHGKVFNIDDDVVGKITFSRNKLYKSDCVLVCERLSRDVKGFAAAITTNEIDGASMPYCVVDETRGFSEGDVVVVNKMGEIIFVYEIQSVHNSIIATERCNHRCLMCPQPPIQYEQDRTPFNLRLISLFDKKTCEIGITGGEPTLIGDDLFVLIEQIKKRLPKTAICILSNGVRFSDLDFSMKLAKCRHHDLQIDIPLFSDIAEEHNRIVGAKTFYKTVQGLYNLALFKQKIGIRMVIHRHTFKRLPQFAEFVYRNFPFVSQVAFMQMETAGLARECFDDLWIDPYDYNEELREAVLLLNERGVKSYIYNSQLCILPEDVRCYAQQTISEWKNIYIEECEGCVLRTKCSGFFAANETTHSAHIRRVDDDFVGVKNI